MVARQVSSAYEKAGHEVHWLVGTRVDPGFKSCTEVRHWEDAAFPSLLSRLLMGGGGFRQRLRWRRLAQMLRLRSSLRQLAGLEDYHLPGLRRAVAGLPWKPDLLHFHNLHGFNHRTHFDPGLLPGLTRETPALVTLHDTWLMTGHCAQHFECGRWRQQCGECPRLRTYPEIRTDRTLDNLEYKRRALASSRLHVVGVCDWILAEARESVLAGAALGWHTIHNGIDPGEAQTALSSQQVPEEAFVVCYASEMGQRNQFRDFLGMREACRRLAAEIGRPVVALELGGQQCFIQREGACEFRSLGFVNRAGVYGALRSSHVLLHAATADSFPTVILEAMSAGLPVVATRVCGIPEQVEDDRTGFLVMPGDVQALVRPLVRLAREAGLAAQLGARGRARLCERFSADRMAGTYLRLVESLAGC